jgi:hypothetical protein
MPQLLAAQKVKLESSSISATVLVVVTALGGLIVGLGVITSTQEGILIAATTAGIAAAGVIANAIHSGQISPSAIEVSVLSVVAQAVALAVSFLWITNGVAAQVTVIVTAGVIAVANIAHALLSRQVPA